MKCHPNNQGVNFVNTYIYLKAKYAAILFILVLPFVCSTVGANHNKIGNNNSSKFANDVLVLVEESIAQLWKNPYISVEKIKAALSLIGRIEGHFPAQTVTTIKSEATKKPEVTYIHYLPEINMELLKGEGEMPTLFHKLSLGVLFHGNTSKDQLENRYFLDFTFAKANLKTALNAIKAGYKFEAKNNMRRVFEAVYVSPDFEVLSHNSQNLSYKG